MVIKIQLPNYVTTKLISSIKGLLPMTEWALFCWKQAFWTILPSCHLMVKPVVLKGFIQPLIIGIPKWPISLGWEHSAGEFYLQAKWLCCSINLFLYIVLFYSRHIIAILHFNENVHRQPKKTKDGHTSYHVHFP
jgi:hypothetical protein